ncbi:stage V sporulation protein AA [Thalassobacillus pellis]|uniref:stage V sporulation protein AA n=1 Tax=Thalassobacillus pellis TaxID=748008 RepID=UPI0019608229|nr:stage V sporulation protein AA [Thalassobacillus pellis]MBM7552399.1 stage V sporulation protein AA [Thalassobacillus pellis]
MSEIVYVRLLRKVEMPNSGPIYVKDIALLSCSTELKNRLEYLPLHYITKKDKNVIVVDGFSVIEKMAEHHKNIDVQILGPAQSIILITQKKKKAAFWMIAGIWLLLYIGAAMAIMNFHYDVSMEAVQQKLHFMLSGEEKEHPFWIQVPYSIGLGLGMILFFNHLFNKKFNEEPSPLEVEVFKYQQSMDAYMAVYENKVEKDDDVRN